jgi:hypothetical protein
MAYPLNVEIICVDDILASLALRSVFEYWGIHVNLHLIPTSKELVSLLKEGKKLSDYIILMAHGDQRGILLPPVSAEIAESYPYQDFISAQQMTSFIHVPDKIVISTACKMGSPDFVDTFLKAGCKAYIACEDYPEGNSALFYVIQLFYNLLDPISSLEEAHQKAVKDDIKCGLFHLFRPSP